VTNLVNQRVIWVFPNVNPDGGEYDTRTGWAYEWWRKNRRQNGDGSFGVDLNRNYGYMWGCCGGSSPYPDSETYRGPAPFSEPETQAIRDFVLDHPEVTVSLSLHTFGEYVLWPWGYTYSPVPDPIDRDTFENLGQALAATNDYRPQQAYHLYLTDGTSDDWLYGERGIIAFTFELYPRTMPPGFYPSDEVIPEQTARNRTAVELLTAMAQDPRRAGGGPGDVISPTVALTATTRYWPPSSTLTLAAQAADDEGVTLVSLHEGVQTPWLRTDQPYTWTLPSGDVPAVREFTARAYDAAHNLALGEPFSVAVGHPHALLTPSVVTGTVCAGDVITQNLSLENAGHGPLTWDLASLPPVWLALEPMAGGLAPAMTQTLTLTLDASTLPSGAYTTTLTLAWDDPFVPQGTVQVSIQVEEILLRRRYLPLALHGAALTASTP